MINPYQELFTCWTDVQREYQHQVPEPKYVLFACYSYEDYAGSSLILYWDKGAYYLEEAEHCSCYGLEEMWGPTKYDTAELLISAAIERTAYGLVKDNKQLLLDAIKRNERRIKNANRS